MTIQQQICLDLIEKFPNAGNLTIARMAHDANKRVFKNMNAARHVVRWLRGVNGKKCREDYIDRGLKSPRTQADAFGKIPEPRNPFNSKWEAVQIDGPLSCLVLSDIHFPFHDRPALLAALNCGQSLDADTILLNGDTLDCHAVSKWEKDPRKRDFAGELEWTRDFLGTLREAFPKARIIFKLGNHEERWESYMYTKAPECLDVEEFKLSSLLKFSDFAVEEVGEKRPIRLGQLNVIHGHEYRFMISNPVNPARGLFLRAKAYALCGHFHQSSTHTEKNVEQRHIATWSTGCLCQLHQDYAPFNNWTHGFAFVTVDKDGKFEVKNHFVSNGKVY